MEKRRNKTKYFLGYLTANDDPSFLVDYLNISNITRYHPGVSGIHVCIALSEVNKIRDSDREKIEQLRTKLMKCRYISDVEIILKSNKGRDFSSAKICLEYFAKFCSDHDYIMIQNRSGYGPLQKNWFLDYVDQNKKLLHGGLTGSTINQSGHPKRDTAGTPTHVQTYVYLSQWKYFKPILSTYPGSQCTERLDVIARGEIGLSQVFIENGLQLNCMYWKDYFFDSNNRFYEELPKGDIKKFVTGLPVKYKFRAYLYRFWSVVDRARWNLYWAFKSALR